ncbi:hypothetical protein CVIRNUC_002899 [Coccomyxa viridis]|uniref:Uncharacterized protein n=1 Tax=Coccomyxa viridis TaxID=1274662 RepID=A0AAV1HY39_9CHLO|nr:hypothetical protein CVIRNUC_002899 [Coccomyxa viridis]
MIEDILYGALTNGVNKPTVLALNAALIGCILSLAALLVLSINGVPSLVPHVGFLLFLAIGLLFLINWFISQVGTVEPKEQRKTLFGEESDAQPAQTSSSTAPVSGGVAKED